MGRRGPKPKSKVKIEWSANFAYAVGLIATDGCLSKDGSRITFVSKDIEQIYNFLRCLDISVAIGTTKSGYNGNIAWRLQFCDGNFHFFLRSIGIHPTKSKTIGEIAISEKYFFDFLRGCFDGDGTVYSYWDKRWKSSFMYYLEFASASREYVYWLRSKITDLAGVLGHITNDGVGKTLQLKYAKRESLLIIKKMYYSTEIVCLSRKRLKIERILSIVGKQSNKAVAFDNHARVL